VNISGDWKLTVLEPTLGCTWVGPAGLVQSGDTFTGSTSLVLRPGSGDQCPTSLVGTVSGTLVGLMIEFGVAMTTETASFEGIVADDQLSASGTWKLAEPSLEGTWSAERVVGVHAPALNAAGLAAVFLLLLAGGVYVLRRRAN